MSSNQNINLIGQPGPEMATGSQPQMPPNGSFHSRHQSSPATLYISPNPEQCLEELFSGSLANASAIKTENKTSLPMWKRRLPPSFFRPPSATSSANHSRESSIDGSGFIPSFSPNPTAHLPPQGPQQSVPVPLPVSQASQMSLGKPPTPQQQLPVSPLHSHSSTGSSLHHHPGIAPTPPPALVSAAGLASLHTRAHSLPASMSIPQPNNLQPNIPQLPVGSSQIFQQLAAFEPTEENLSRVSLPEGWQEAFTNEGDRYFLNHHEKNTTWDDPRKHILLQQKQHFLQQQQQQQQLVTAMQNMNTSGAGQELNADLRALAMERDRYKARQNEIQQQQQQQNPSNSGQNPLINDQFMTDYNGNHTNTFSSCFDATSGLGLSAGSAAANELLTQNFQDLFDPNGSELPDLDMDVLNDVEDLLNTNNNNIMTWL